jgi:ubiquinone/menaquinone biosynthesis C-methylase UbiE
MALSTKAYKGMAMEGFIASWYARNTGRNLGRFKAGLEVVRSLLPSGGRVLEVAPGPGYLAIELARAGYRVTGVDISRSFVQIATDHARRAGVELDVRQGDAAHLSLPASSFDAVVCMAAFKNFTDPLGALDEFHRVLCPGGTALVFDLRKEASEEAIAREVEGMALSPWNAAVTRFTFRFMLLRRAYSRPELTHLAEVSRFGTGEIRDAGVGFELRLRKEVERS